MKPFIEMSPEKVKEMCYEAREAVSQHYEPLIQLHRETMEETRKTFWGRLFNSKAKVQMMEDMIWKSMAIELAHITNLLNLANKGDKVYLDADSLYQISWLVYKGEE